MTHGPACHIPLRLDLNFNSGQKVLVLLQDGQCAKIDIAFDANGVEERIRAGLLHFFFDGFFIHLKDRGEEGNILCIEIYRCQHHDIRWPVVDQESSFSVVDISADRHFDDSANAVFFRFLSIFIAVDVLQLVQPTDNDH